MIKIGMCIWISPDHQKKKNDDYLSNDSFMYH
jgi:hypothetical protein